MESITLGSIYHTYVLVFLHLPYAKVEERPCHILSPVFLRKQTPLYRRMYLSTRSVLLRVRVLFLLLFFRLVLRRLEWVGLEWVGLDRRMGEKYETNNHDLIGLE